MRVGTAKKKIKPRVAKARRGPGERSETTLHLKSKRDSSTAQIDPFTGSERRRKRRLVPAGMPVRFSAGTFTCGSTWLPKKPDADLFHRLGRSQSLPVVGVADAAGGVGSFTKIGQRGKAKLPALSSTTFTWQV